MTKTASRSSRLDRAFDRIRDREEAGLIAKSRHGRAVSKILSNKLAVFGFVTAAIIILASLFAPLLTRYDPTAIDLRSILNPPSAKHLLGTDKVGRDVFSRILYGGRVSILVGLGSSLGAALIGVGIGAYTGYKGGWLDGILLRVSEVVMAFPRSSWCCSSWPSPARA